MDNRQQLKQNLLHQATALGQTALLPTENHELNAIVQALEALNPTSAPLAPEQRSLLLGEWQLIYASRGTVITRQLVPGVTIQAIWQTLRPATAAAIAVTNGMELKLPLLGRLHLEAAGTWQWQGETQMATVVFDAFSLQTTHLLHQADWQLPPLHIPVLEWMKREASWQTSYLDSDLRIGCGATGNRFVFRRYHWC